MTIIRWAMALALALSPLAAVAQTASAIQAPAGYAPMSAPCVKQADGKCSPVAATVPMPVTNAERWTVYAATSDNYAAYAAPTDMLTITAPAGKRLVIRDIRMIAGATASTMINVQFLTRSTANTGGTATDLTPWGRNSQDGASSASVKLYSTAPTTGTLSRTISTVRASAAATTSNPTVFSPSNAGSSAAGMFPVVNPSLVLNPGETMAINFAGAVLPAGFTASVGIVWSEETL